MSVPEHPPRLEIRDLHKAFAAPALRNVSLQIAPGEVHALVGENGAGKSTLVKILAGLVRKDAGDVYLDGEVFEPRSAKEGLSAGVSLASQELGVIDALSVAENIALRALPSRRGVVDRQVLERDARVQLDRVGLAHVRPNASSAALSVGERQLVELARAVRLPSRLVILDEPTAALNDAQARTVHAIVRELKGSGVSVIYISHRLHDVLDVADRVTVLRDGEVAASTSASALSVEQMVTLMTGEAVRAIETEARPVRHCLLQARAATTDELPYPIDLQCAAGEILGVAGLAGAGKSELLRLLFGLAPLTGGSVLRYDDDKPLPVAGAPAAIALGMGYLPDDRRAAGIFPGLSVLDNLMTPGVAGASLLRVRGQSERLAGAALIERMAVRCDNLDQDIAELSGGNQQKALIARWVHRGSRVLILDEPTRGIDVGTKQRIYRLLVELAHDGRGIVVASSEVDELMSIADRIVVMSNRRAVDEFVRGAWSEAEILAAAFREYSGRIDVASRQDVNR